MEDYFEKWDFSVDIKSLDQIDRRILREVQANGRLTNTELSERVHLSATATNERVKRLTRDGFILGYTALLSPERLGRGLLLFVEVKLERTTPDVFDAFAAAIRRTPDVLECHLIAGGFDYLVKARVSDMAAYRHFLSGLLTSVPGVRETRTYTVMEEVKESMDLPI